MYQVYSDLEGGMVPPVPLSYVLCGSKKLLPNLEEPRSTEVGSSRKDSGWEGVSVEQD